MSADSLPILVVDDSATMRRIVGAALESGGWRVMSAANGLEALETVAARPVALVVTDVNMPVMDGISFIRRLRATPGCEALPVVVLSTERDEASREQARTAGANAWVDKPVDDVAIRQVAAALLGSVARDPS